VNVGTSEHVPVAEHLATLKRLVLMSAEPSEPLGYFFQHMATDPQLERASTPAVSTVLVQMIQALLAQHYGQIFPAVIPGLRHAQPYHFWYGDCLLGPHRVWLLFFDDVEIGILMAMRPTGSGDLDYLRFSVIRRNRQAAQH
jgi:hypothetical protein